MKNSMMKLFIGTTIWTFSFFVIAVYAANKAYEQDPQIMSKVSKHLGMNISMNRMFIGDRDAASFVETKDVWNFSTPRKIINLRTINADVEFSETEDPEIHIKAQGKLDTSSAPHLLDTDFNGDELSLSQHDEDVVRDLKIQIQIPKNYRQAVQVLSVTGDIHWMPMNLEKIEMKTVSGDMDSKKLNVTELEAETVSGNIEMELQKIGGASIKTISGNVHLEIPPMDKMNFSLESISGSIKNSLPSFSESRTKIDVKTTSGSIEIL